MKIVFLERATMGQTPLDEIMQLGEFVSYERTSREEAFERVSDCEVLVINKTKVDDELMSHAPKLKLVCICATGVNNIDLEAANRRGIIVRNVAGYSTDSVAQSTFTHMLSLLGNAAFFDNFVKSGDYTRSRLFADVSHPYVEVAGKSLGIIGMGAIGTKVATIASAFGMKVSYYSTSGTSHCSEYPSISLEELLRNSDVVSIHAPLNSRTEGLIGEKELALMKPTAILLNMGRGGIVNESALAAAVDKGTIAGAGIDVFVEEPLPDSHPFLHMEHPERLSLSPHSAWASREALSRLITSVADNIRKGW